MALERLYELIRKEDVVLFCGAGMSAYAGYPSGNALAQIIYDQLTPSELDEIPAGLALPDLTEQLLDLRLSRQSLIALLKDIYNKTPTDFRVHKELAGIPNFKTVITTNYDRLFELAYGDNCSVILKSADLTYLKKDATEIFKVHGDLSQPETILITKTDYTKFFDSQKEDVLWTVVKERIATHHVLFIGYNLDDINMESIFRKMKENLGDHHKEIFLIAPSVKAPKLQRLIKDGIHYIDSKADVFFAALLKDIKNNIKSDFEKQWCSPDTFRIFLQRNNLAPTLKAEDDHFKITGVEAIKGPLSVKFGFSVTEEQKKVIEQLDNILQGKELGTITLDSDTVSNLHIFLNSIKVSDGDDGPLTFSSMPIKTGMIDLTFESGVEFENLKVEVYRTQSEIIFSIVLPNVNVQLHTSPQQLEQLRYQLTIKRTGDYGKLSDEWRIASLLKEISVQQRITVFIKDERPMKFQMTDVEPLADHAEKFIYYFERLKKIEKHYGFKFEHIGEITNQTYNNLNLITAHIEGQPYLGVFADGWMVQTSEPEKAMQILEQISPNSELVQKKGERDIIQFHGQAIDLGYCTVKLLEPYVVNLDEVKKDPTKSFEIRSASETISITFSDQQ
jgi:NAD-dependent SIR2 family protein deacetylase